MMGNNPRVIPILMAKWKKKMLATPYPYNVAKVEPPRSASITIRKISSVNSPIKSILPTKPNSSAIVQKIKSVLFSGTKSNFVCVPFK